MLWPEEEEARHLEEDEFDVKRVEITCTCRELQAGGGDDEDEDDEG